MTLPDILELFDTDEKCRELLERLRWPNGPECLRCKSEDVVRLETNTKLFWCPICDYQFGVTVGSIFHDSHLPLSKWFIATLLLCESRKGFSANQMKRTLGVSYKTAWYLCHRIRAAMQDEKTMLDGTVKMDETYVGGKPRIGRPIREKDVVIGIRQRGIFGTRHRISTKHLPAYLNEMSFRLNRRKDHNIFLDTLRHMVTADPLTFERLTA